ncbi:MAG: D-alanyl-D-alanine carboxypeptidase family protein [Novosphingobium sp.]
MASAAFPPPAAKDAPVALLVDLTAGGQVLFAREAEGAFLPASITKVMTAYVAFEAIRAGRLREDQVLVARPETVAKWAWKGTTMRLEPGQAVRVGDLLSGIAIASANDGAAVLAEGAAGSVEAWVALMNAEAMRLGMKGSRFGTPNGWPDQGVTRVTPRDLVRLTDALVHRHPQLYRRYFGRSAFTFNSAVLKNHDPTLGLVAGADGIKTGHTFEAGYTFLGSAQRNGRRLVVVTGRSWSTDGRARAARDLLEWGFTAWDSRQLIHAGQIVGEARVQQGDARSVALTTPRGYTLAVPKGSNARPVTRVRYDGPLRAPLAKGARVAVLEIETSAAAPVVVPLYAAEAVGRAGPLDRLVNGLVGLFT